MTIIGYCDNFALAPKVVTISLFYCNLECAISAQDKKADLQTCDKCGKVLKGIDTLRYHIKAVHENLREWKCDEPGCDKAFVESHQLDK